ncbi:ATP synthase F0 subunit B [bacterium]|nr:ATP synthase F0 subunit B [bacterium]
MEFNGTFLATIPTFILFVFLMNKILYVPILKIMVQRDAFIKDNQATVQENNNKIKELSDKKNNDLLEAKKNAKAKYLNILEQFKTKKTELIEDAKNVADKDLQSAESELENTSVKISDALKDRINDLASDITEKIIGYRSDFQNVENEKINEILYK